MSFQEYKITEYVISIAILLTQDREPGGMAEKQFDARTDKRCEWSSTTDCATRWRPKTAAADIERRRPR